MIRVGLTGGIASGKSAVGELLRQHGALVIDSDQLARDVVAPGSAGLAAVIERFGAGILLPDGGLDRAALGRLVFSDDAARAELNAIIHPRVRAAATAIEAQVSDPYAIVVHMIPLLVETGQQDSFDALVVVDVDEDTQRARLMARNDLTEDEAQARIDAQVSRTDRLRVADFVIRNDAGLEELAERAHAVWHELLKRRGQQGDGCGC
ncbi:MULTISPECIES: dephospho-CoA kinase [Luteococcus]|uniref:Dephospho-CoA kinase n=1 Tax=Luteococcus japonicus LSP_Lj1 TaxID=1255658 RepID=A0A1R4KLR0_9ACTN|nr:MULTISPECIES: dephospho-CoA kinase [Luteococcus]MDN5563426.1 dephospho-CoA kinase [Luteococcus sp.]SJN45280.1 Dephospho-CoA kinase [Luteococcus japonicus LSP_Lj1]